MGTGLRFAWKVCDPCFAPNSCVTQLEGSHPSQSAFLVQVASIKLAQPTGMLVSRRPRGCPSFLNALTYVFHMRPIWFLTRAQLSLMFWRCAAHESVCAARTERCSETHA